MPVLRLLCAAALVLAPAPPSEEVFTEADELWSAGDYEGVIERLERAAAADPNLSADYLFGLARAEVVLGRCDAAVGHLEAYLATDLSAVARESAEAELEKCNVEPAPTEPTTASVPSPQSFPVAPPPPVQHDREVRSRDPLGWSMVGVGGVLTVVGATLFAVGASGTLRPPATANEQTYRDRTQVSQRLAWSGAAVGVAGAAVLIGGAIRLALETRRARRR